MIRYHHTPIRMGKKPTETHLTAANARRTQSSLTLLHCRWKCKWYSHFGKYLSVSCKIKHALSLWFAGPTPGYLPKRNETIWLHRSLWQCYFCLPLCCIQWNQLFGTPWTIACLPGSSVHGILQASIPEYQNGLPFPAPEDLPDPGIEPASPASPALVGEFFIHCPTWEAPCNGTVLSSR